MFKIDNKKESNKSLLYIFGIFIKSISASVYEIIGDIKSPVQGRIISNYGEGKDSRKSKNGVIFQVLEESFVTSPINGVVVYANQFRSYGNLVIIENDEGYYCILSGMKKIIILIFRMSDVIRTYENTLYKVRSKKWGHPLGKAMSITGTVYRLGQ